MALACNKKEQHDKCLQKARATWQWFAKQQTEHHSSGLQIKTLRGMAMVCTIKHRRSTAGSAQQRQTLHHGSGLQITKLNIMAMVCHMQLSSMAMVCNSKLSIMAIVCKES